MGWQDPSNYFFPGPFNMNLLDLAKHYACIICAKQTCLQMYTHVNPTLHGCGSKKRYQHGTLVGGNMDQNLRFPSCLMLSHMAQK